MANLDVRNLTEKYVYLQDENEEFFNKPKNKVIVVSSLALSPVVLGVIVSVYTSSTQALPLTFLLGFGLAVSGSIGAYSHTLFQRSREAEILDMVTSQLKTWLAEDHMVHAKPEELQKVANGLLQGEVQLTFTASHGEQYTLTKQKDLTWSLTAVAAESKNLPSWVKRYVRKR